MIPTLFIGLDPGASGGLALIAPDMVRAVPMPATERDVLDWIRRCRGDAAAGIIHKPQAFAVIEKVGGYISGNPCPGSAMFKFGQGYGGLRMALVATGIPFEEVTPQRWQKEFLLTRKKGEAKTPFKNRLKAKAQQLFPEMEPTLKTADAILIALYCQRKYGAQA